MIAPSDTSKVTVVVPRAPRRSTTVYSTTISSVLATALGKDWKGKLSPIAYAVAIPVAFLNPKVSNALFVAVALVWLIPDRRIERALAAPGKG